MEKEEYQKLMDLTLEMRILEGILAEAVGRFKKANEVLRELILKEREDE